MWPPRWTVGGDRLSRSHGSRHIMPRIDNLDVNETFFYNSSRFNVTLFDAVASTVNVYYTPLLVVLGILGNILSVYVFNTSNLRLQSTSQYLTALAISDSIFLLQLLPPWLNALQLASLFHQQVWCQLFVYISYVSCCLSAWLVVAFTVERFVAVLFPLRRNVLSTVARARVIIYTLGTWSVFLNLPVLRFATPTKHDCNIDMNYLDEAKWFNLVDTIASFSVPFAVIVALNTWIVIGVCRIEHARHALMKQHRRTESAPGVISVGSARTSRQLLMHARAAPPRSQHRVTRMLLIVSSGYVLLNVPAYAMRLYAYAYDIDKVEFASWDGLQQVALMFFNTNFGINFLLYCISGQNFRRALAAAMPWTRLRARRAAVDRLNQRFTRGGSISDGSTTNFTTAHAGSTPDLRRRQLVNVISRWMYETSRQQTYALAHAPPSGSHELGLKALSRGPRPPACSEQAIAHDPGNSAAITKTNETCF